MKVIDLTKDYKQLYFVCLEDWSEEIKEAGGHKKAWYNKMKDEGLRVKLAVDDNGEVGGMIQYILSPLIYSYISLPLYIVILLGIVVNLFRYFVSSE